MPYKFEKLSISNEKLDKRVKLTAEQKSKIFDEYKTGLHSLNSLAKKYGVSKRTIHFIVAPDKYEKAKAQFADRQKDGRYYDKDKHKVYMQKHRLHKKELYKEGLLKEREE